MQGLLFHQLEWGLLVRWVRPLVLCSFPHEVVSGAFFETSACCSRFWTKQYMQIPTAVFQILVFRCIDFERLGTGGGSIVTETYSCLSDLELFWSVASWNANWSFLLGTSRWSGVGQPLHWGVRLFVVVRPEHRVLCQLAPNFHWVLQEPLRHQWEDCKSSHGLPGVSHLGPVHLQRGFWLIWGVLINLGGFD